MLFFRKTSQTILFLGAIAFVLAVVPGSPEVAHAQAKKAPAKNAIAPPPDDVNDLSMEVAALRALYLLKVDRLQLKGAVNRSEACAMKPRKREKADVSANYRKVLTELRAALIAGQDERIEELSEQLEDLAKEEMPTLDDEIEITQEARQHAPKWILFFDGDAIVKYLAAYGKDFPNPRKLLYQTMRLDGNGKKPGPEEWKEIRANVIREVSWMIGGIDLEKAKPQKIGDRVAALLDKAYALSDAELKRQKAKLVGEINSIVLLSPTEIIKHVIEQDLAELLSNPRLKAAAEARVEHLKKMGG